MKPLNFHDLRSALQAISDVMGEGYLIGCSWDGSLFRVSVGRRECDTEVWRKPWVMTFDSEDDYSVEPTNLIAELARGAKAWFGLQKDEA